MSEQISQPDVSSNSQMSNQNLGDTLSTSDTSGTENQNTNKKFPLTKILIVLVVVLGLISTYFGYIDMNTETVQEEKAVSTDTTTKDIEQDSEEIKADSTMNSYINADYGFSFNLNEGERALACENKNEYNDNVAVWVTYRPKPPVGFNECATEGPVETIFVSKKAADFTTVEDYLVLVSRNYFITKESIKISGVEAIRIKGQRNSFEPAPIPDSRDAVVFFNDGALYVIEASFLSRGFSL